jgi:hypothetical protein
VEARTGLRTSTVSATGEPHLSVHTNRCIVSHPLRSDFAVKFGLNSLPTVIVVSQSKKKFVNLVGMFNDKSIASFLDGVLSGKHGTSSFQDLPQVLQLASPVARVMSTAICSPLTHCTAQQARMR